MGDAKTPATRAEAARMEVNDCMLMEEDWRKIGGRLEEDWRKIGGGFRGYVEVTDDKKLTLLKTLQIGKA
jgi:hypothetical protein